MPTRKYNKVYTGKNLDRVAFPLGGIGAGMICIEGTGALSHVSVNNKPEVFRNSQAFAALCVKGEENVARVLEGPVPTWKYFGMPESGRGLRKSDYGLPRMRDVSFEGKFPFATIQLSDEEVPLKAHITAWSPFVPGDSDNSSLPVAALEYSFHNPTDEKVEAIFSFNSANFMFPGGKPETERSDSITATQRGFVLCGPTIDAKPREKGQFLVRVDDEGAIVDYVWFRGHRFDAQVDLWRNIETGVCPANPPVDGVSPGASIFVPFTLEAGEAKMIRVMLSWYSPETEIRHPVSENYDKFGEGTDCECESKRDDGDTFAPWYSGRFGNVEEVAAYLEEKYSELKERSEIFRDCFYDTTLPDEVVEAVAANLTILKSPTVMRQTDGRLWAWEGCSDDEGCCHGSCTHVWNYAQALPHLFPDLERTFRESEHFNCQNDEGHQDFRAPIPLRSITPHYQGAADGQLGGIMQIYREWRISGDEEWLKKVWPRAKASMDHSIGFWDPDERGVLVKAQHNTYDIQFFGPNSMCSSYYIGALQAVVKMGSFLGEDISRYEDLLQKGKTHIDSELFNGEYFHQKVEWDTLETPYHGLSTMSKSPEGEAIIEKEGPKYQYGDGCLSDALVGLWLARMCGIDEDILDREKVASTLKSIYKYNLKHDLSQHANPARPTYALGNEGGLLLCTWPKGGRQTFPFYFAFEVWTGIEYQVAGHLIMEGMLEEGLDVVRTCRDRYTGTIRNPYNEYECGHWYARAMASYGLIHALTGVRYDAVDRTLYFDSRVGDNFRCFLATATGFGTVGMKNGEPFVEVKMGEIDVEKTVVKACE
ncbi:GH116 family glycosyl hydrolase [Candidatus Hydrogenedentota bacterium]